MRLAIKIPAIFTTPPRQGSARREAPVFFSNVLQMWTVSRYDDVHAVLEEPRLFSSKDSIKSIDSLCPEALAVLQTGVPPTPFIINSDPPGHSRWRRVINRAFSGVMRDLSALH